MIGSDVAIEIGQSVKCWGLIGGPYHGKVIGKDESKDCWVVRLTDKDGYTWKTSLHSDYIQVKK
jgi:hypothetical protein